MSYRMLLKKSTHLISRNKYKKVSTCFFFSCNLENYVNYDIDLSILPIKYKYLLPS